MIRVNATIDVIITEPMKFWFFYSYGLNAFFTGAQIYLLIIYTIMNNIGIKRLNVEFRMLKNKILIVYGSRYGATEEIAIKISSDLQEIGMVTDLINLKNIEKTSWPNISDYKAIFSV